MTYMSQHIHIDPYTDAVTDMTMLHSVGLDNWRRFNMGKVTGGVTYMETTVTVAQSIYLHGGQCAGSWRLWSVMYSLQTLLLGSQDLTYLAVRGRCSTNSRLARTVVLPTCTSGALPHWASVRVASENKNHVADSFPLTMLKGGLFSLHEAGSDAIQWLENR